MADKTKMVYEKSIRLVSAPIRNQIDEEGKRLEQETHYHVRRRKIIFEFLKKESHKHSAKIELPNGDTLSGKDALVYMWENLANAHNHFCTHFVAKLNRDILFETWALIEPDTLARKFRTEHDGMCWAQHMRRTYPRDVSGELDYFFEENNSIDNPLDRALHAHLHIARIHPFMDGNGRLARLIQNGILVDGNYPPIIIDQNDRHDYMTLIRDAQTSYEQRDRKMTRQQAAFYNYLAMNLWCSLKKARKLVEDKTESVRARAYR